MKYCPACNSEYREDINECADCQGSLISEQAYQEIRKKREELSKNNFVSVKIAGNFFEADSIRSALEREGISVLLRTFHDTAYNLVYVSHQGWGSIEVPLPDKERAEQIIKEFTLAFPDEDTPGKDDSEE
jgi:hypothetical protein